MGQRLFTWIYGMGLFVTIIYYALNLMWYCSPGNIFEHDLKSRVLDVWLLVFFYCFFIQIGVFAFHVFRVLSKSYEKGERIQWGNFLLMFLNMAFFLLGLVPGLGDVIHSFLVMLGD